MAHEIDWTEFERLVELAEQRVEQTVDGELEGVVMPDDKEEDDGRYKAIVNWNNTAERGMATDAADDIDTIEYCRRILYNLWQASVDIDMEIDDDDEDL